MASLLSLENTVERLLADCEMAPIPSPNEDDDSLTIEIDDSALHRANAIHATAESSTLEIVVDASASDSKSSSKFTTVSALRDKQQPSQLAAHALTLLVAICEVCERTISSSSASASPSTASGVRASPKTPNSPLTATRGRPSSASTTRPSLVQRRMKTSSHEETSAGSNTDSAPLRTWHKQERVKRALLRAKKFGAVSDGSLLAGKAELLLKAIENAP